MFKELANFKLKRTPLQALGFYIVYFVVTIVIGATLATVLGLATGNTNNFQFGYKIGNLSAVAISMVLSFLVLQQKKMINDVGWLLLGLSAGLLAFYGGALLGLIPSTILTTRK